jgi:hypothetical protein
MSMAENENAISPAPAEGGEAAGVVSGEAGGETGGETGGAATAPAPETPAAPPEEITYHAVEKDGQVTAIWEMQGRKHLRTIDPRSRQGQEILRLYTAEHHDEH